VDNSIVINEIEKILSREFVCYGYKKTTKQLNRTGYMINRKKVRRLMDEKQSTQPFIQQDRASKEGCEFNSCAKLSRSGVGI
jgi:hypothetical protein